MKKSLMLALCFSLASFFMTSVLAEDQPAYQQKTLPDGSTEMNYSSGDATVRQIQHPDGTMETHTIDVNGNETITTQDKDGNIQVQTKKKGS